MTVPAAPAAPADRTRRPGLVLAVCSLSVFLTGLDATIVVIGLPAMSRSLHAGVSGLAWAVAAYTVTLASLLMFSGAAADRIGRRAVLQAGLSLFVLGSWLCSLAPSLGCLIAFRVIQGAGGSAMNPAALGIITTTFTDPARRARAIGAWDAVYGLSMVLGPVLGGILVAAAGWRAVFWATVPAGLAALGMTGLYAPDSLSPRPRRPDPAGQALVTVMLAALVTAIIQAPGWGWLSPQTAVLLAAAVAALAGLLYCQPRRADPLIQLGLFRSAPFAAANLMAVSGIAALAGFGFLSTLYLQDIRGMTALHAGLAILPMAAAMAAYSPMAGQLIAWRGSRLPAVLAGSALTASSAALTTLTATSSPAFLSLTYILFGTGAGLLSPAITYGVMSGVPSRQAGLASGMNSTSRQVGQSLGVAVTGAVLASSLHGPVQSGFLPAARAAWWVMAGCGLCVLLAGLAGTTRRVPPRRPAGRHARTRASRPAGPGRGTGRHAAVPPRPDWRPAIARQARVLAGSRGRHARHGRRPAAFAWRGQHPAACRPPSSGQSSCDQGDTLSLNQEPITGSSTDAHSVAAGDPRPE